MESSGKRRVFVVGVGMTKFEKPGTREDFDYPDMAKEAGLKALEDAGVTFTDIQAASVGYVYGESTSGQRAVYELGMTGIPVYNVNNNCATGSTALLLARQLILTGEVNCALALGFEKMKRGSLSSQFPDYTSPLDKHVQVLVDVYGFEPVSGVIQIFGNAGREHMKRYGTKPETFAKIAAKNHRHSVNNPYSQFQDDYSLEQILNSPVIFHPLTKLQCCPTSNGAAAAIVVSEEFVKRHKLQGQAVEILAMEMATDLPSTLTENNAIKLAGYDVTKLAAKKAFQYSGLTAASVQVVELHDCFSTNELISYEALGLCPEGGAEKFVENGDNTYSGAYVINPSGGLISKGHPLGATGLAQCAELCWQLRGRAGKRQVQRARVGLQHNIGLGGAAIVALYRLGFLDRETPSIENTVNVKDDKELLFKSSQLFKHITQTLEKNGENLVKRLRCVYCFKVKKGPVEGVWVVDVKNGRGSVAFGKEKKADTTILISDDDLYDMAMGKLNSQQAFLRGKLKIQGNMALAMKLREILPPAKTSKL